jgi:hypothetical protein
MAEFDETKLQVDRVPWSETNVAVRYDGHYCGAVQKVNEGEYSCAVSMERDGEKILQAFGRSDSIETGARDVVEQWLLVHSHELPESLR